MEFKHLQSLTYQLVTLKTVTQFLVSVSVFSYLFSHSSWCPFLLHSSKSYLSAILLHTLDKRWIFLICNGILVVLASTSSLVSSPSGFDLNDIMHNKIGDGLQHTPEDRKDEFLLEEEEILFETCADQQSGNAVPEGEGGERNENDQEINEEEAEEEGNQDDEHMEEEQGLGDNSSLMMEGYDQEQVPEIGFLKLEGRLGEHEAEAVETRTYILEDDQDNNKDSETDFIWEEEVGAGGMEKLSAEELNKKFEDFIRKMKEELRIDAQQQLVVVK